MTSRTIDYMAKNGYMADFVRHISDWQAFQDREDLNYLMQMIPEDCMEEYTEVLTAYRGMLVDPNKVHDQVMCSWSVDEGKAQYFSKLISRGHKVDTASMQAYYSQVYMATQRYFKLYELIQDVYTWLDGNIDTILGEINEFIEDVETAEDLKAYFDEEGEVLGDFRPDTQTLKSNIKYIRSWGEL